jgi:cation diffusion facilitator CzcD-associated flavoprotein CzcO
MSVDQSNSPVGLAEGVANASPALLLATLVSITGRTDRIPEFAPLITTEIANYALQTKMPEDAREKLNAWAMETLSSLDGLDTRPIDDESFHVLAQTLFGMPISEASIPFLRDQAGFASAITARKPFANVPKGFKLAIVGAGMAGVAAAVAAKTAGIDFEVFEKNPGIGGVWWENRYPGVGVDTHSNYYSLSFAINPAWTNSYPEGGEFREYLNRVVREYAVLDHFTFDAQVTDLIWDEKEARWDITYWQHGAKHVTTATAVLTAAGYLSRPALPDVPGLQEFEGHWCHSGDWDDGYDFTGKRLAVIGTGCTSVQIVDALAPRIKSLKLFQRQPHWVTSVAGDSKIAEPERWMLMNVPGYAQWARLHTFLMIGDINYAAVRYDPEWAKDHDMSISAANEVGMRFSLAHLERSFADRPDLLEKMKPDFAFMGKRPIRDPGAYYEALKKESSEVITSGLAEVRPNGLVDGDGNFHEVDAVVYATGFELKFLSHWNIVGRDGISLADKWAERPSAYLGCQVPGFPNLFVTSGPNANPSHGGGHNFCVEAVIHHVFETLRVMIERNAATIEPTEKATRRWQEDVDRKLEDSIWVRETRATTYYRNASGKVVLSNPFKMEDYWTWLREPVLEDLVLTQEEARPFASA